MLASEDQQLAVDGLRKFLDAQIEPVVQNYRDKLIPKETMIQVMEQLVEFGLVSAPYPENVGGMGMDWVTHMQLFEELAYTSSDLALALSINAIVASLMLESAPDHIMEEYFPRVISGQSLISLGVSEPGVGSDVSSITVRAKRDGDHYVINGEKTWITNGEYTDFLIVTARTEDGGLTHILVDREKHGYETRNIEKIGLASQSTAQVFFDDCRVPVENRIGEEGKGLSKTLKTFEIARIFVAVWAIGLARRALDETIAYTTERKQHGKVIAAHQLVAGQIAEMATELEAAKCLTYKALDMIEAGDMAAATVSMAKWYSCEMAINVTRAAVHLHGANGICKEFLVEKLHREAMILPNPDGTTNIQKLVIARALTGINAFR